MCTNRLTLWEKLKDENKKFIEQSREEYPFMTESCIKNLKNTTFVMDLTVAQLDSVTMLCGSTDWNKVYNLFND
jgi:hypothetical protein